MTINRRGFLQVCAVGGAAAAILPRLPRPQTDFEKWVEWVGRQLQRVERKVCERKYFAFVSSGHPDFDFKHVQRRLMLYRPDIYRLECLESPQNPGDLLVRGLFGGVTPNPVRRKIPIERIVTA